MTISILPVSTRIFPPAFSKKAGGDGSGGSSGRMPPPGGEATKSAKFVTRVEAVTDDAGTEVTLADTPVPGSVAVYAHGDDCGTELS